MRYVLFDLYGVFYKVKSPEQWTQLAAKIGADINELHPLFARKYRSDYDAGHLNVEEYWRQIGTDLGMDIDWEIALAADLASFGGVDEEMVHFACELRGKGIRLAMLSNEPKEMTDRTKTRDWITLFEPAIFSSDVALIKPDPAIFELALERLRESSGDDLDPGDILFVDDTLENIEAARELGFATHHFEGIQGLRDRVARTTFSTDG